MFISHHGITDSTRCHYLLSKTSYIIHYNHLFLIANVVNSQQFNELKAQDTLLVADFSATWCGPCKALAPILDEVGAEMTGKANVVKIDVDESEDLAIEFGIRSVPTVLFFKNGQIVDKFVGVVPKAQIVEKINNQL